MDLVRDSTLGVEFEIDPRFARLETAAVAPDVTAITHGGNGNGAGGNGHGPGAGGSEAAGAAVPPELPTAHFIASDPAAGWIAALAIVTVASAPLPAAAWLEQQLLRARASFAQWSPASHEMLVAPETAELAGRPALHVRYRLTGADEGGVAAEDGADESDSPDSADAHSPPALVEHWTVLVTERSRLLAMELMVQPPARWEAEQAAFDLPFRTLALI
jgi:hypothetical protein